MARRVGVVLAVLGLLGACFCLLAVERACHRSIRVASVMCEKVPRQSEVGFLFASSRVISGAPCIGAAVCFEVFIRSERPYFTFPKGRVQACALNSC